MGKKESFVDTLEYWVGKGLESFWKVFFYSLIFFVLFFVWIVYIDAYFKINWFFVFIIIIIWFCGERRIYRLEKIIDKLERKIEYRKERK